MDSPRSRRYAQKKSLSREFEIYVLGPTESHPIHARLPQGAALIGVFAQCRSSSVIFIWPGDPPAKDDTVCVCLMAMMMAVAMVMVMRMMMDDDDGDDGGAGDRDEGDDEDEGDDDDDDDADGDRRR